MQFREVSFVDTFTWEAVRYGNLAFSFLLPALTAYWAWAAYRCGKKNGYIWLAVLALAPYFGSTLHRIGNRIYRESSTEKSYEPDDATIQTARPVRIVQTSRFPLWQAGFATAILLLYRAEMKQSQRNLANKAAEPTRTSGTPPADAGDRASGARGSL